MLEPLHHPKDLAASNRAFEARINAIRDVLSGPASGQGDVLTWLNPPP